MASEINGLGATNKEGMGVGVTDTIDMGLFSNSGCGTKGANPMQVVSVDVRSGP